MCDRPRMSAPISAWRFITTRSSGVKLPAFFSTASGMPILPTSCIGAALRSRSAQIGGFTDRQRQRLGQETHAHDVRTGVAVAEFGRQGQPEQRFVVGLRDLLQRLVALAVHAAQVLHQSFHLRAGIGVETVVVHGRVRGGPQHGDDGRLQGGHEQDCCRYRF
jgi:hypothetical protein